MVQQGKRQILVSCFRSSSSRSFHKINKIELERQPDKAHDKIIDGISCSANRKDAGSQIARVVCQLKLD